MKPIGGFSAQLPSITLLAKGVELGYGIEVWPTIKRGYATNESMTTKCPFRVKRYKCRSTSNTSSQPLIAILR
jgi:hypothetical protein